MADLSAPTARTISDLTLIGSNALPFLLLADKKIRQDWGELLLLFVVLGAGEALIWPVLGALAVEEGRIYGHGTMMGVFNLSMSCGIFFGSLGAGFVMDFWGLRWSFVTIGITVLFLSLAAIAMIRSGERARREE